MMMARPRSPASLFLTLLLCLVACVACGPVAEKVGGPDTPAAIKEAAGTPAAPGSEAGAQSPATEAPATGNKETKPGENPARPLTPECQKLLGEIEALDKTIPMIFVDLKRSPDEINKDMIRLADLCRRFLKDCPGTEATCEVKSVLVRMLMGRNARYAEELREKGLSAAEVRQNLADYQAEIIDLGSAAAADCAKGSRYRLVAMLMLMEAYSKVARHKDCRDIAARLLEEDPPYDIRTGTIDTLALSLLSEGKYEDAVKYSREIINKYSDDPDYVVYNIRLFDALTGTGDLQGMEELMHLLRVEYPQRIGAVKDDILKAQYKQWYHLALFWLGFIHMASGDTAGAKQYFDEFVAEVQSLRAELTAKGEAIDPVLDIVQRFRAEHLLEFLTGYQGKVPQVDFDLDDMWATAKKVNLRDSRGKVVVVVFRRPEDKRSARFLQEIDRFVKAREKDGLVGVTIGFLSGRRTSEQDATLIQKSLDDLSDLGVSLPAGFDPDQEHQKIVRGLFGTVGTASCAVINRKGELTWWLADARDMDSKLAEKVIDRLLKEPAP